METDRDESAPKVRTYPLRYSHNVDKVMDLRKRMRETVAHEFLGKRPIGESFARLVSLFLEMLPAGVDPQAVEDSVRHFAGALVTDEDLDATCWRLAGNTKRLAERRAVPPWHGQRLGEWVPAHVVSAKRSRNSRGTLGVELGFRVLAGTPASLTSYAWWSLRLTRYMSQFFGHDRTRGSRTARRPYSVPEQLVGQRIALRMSPDKSTSTEPKFDQVAFPAYARKWNRLTLLCRARAAPGFRCLLGKPETELPCHKCPVGFLRCRAATHRADWEVKLCPGCNAEAFFGTEHPSDKCIDCNIVQVYKGDK